jgi:hypothetical protein
MTDFPLGPISCSPMPRCPDCDSQDIETVTDGDLVNCSGHR